VRNLISIALAGALAAGVVACGEKDEPEPAPPTVATGATGPSETPGGGEGSGGGGDGNEGGRQVTPEEQVERAVDAVVGGGDPDEVCQDLVTGPYVTRAYGDEAGCRAAVATQDPFGVDVSAVRIAGAGATARAKPRGGPNKGEMIRVKLVKGGGAWKVDSALSNAPAGP